MQYSRNSGTFMIRATALLLLMVLAPVALARQHSPAAAGVDAPGHFDYYLLALSWSPSYCVVHPGDQHQCQGRGFGFVLHGLWPQSNAGGGLEPVEYFRTADRATAVLHIPAVFAAPGADQHLSPAQILAAFGAALRSWGPRQLSVGADPGARRPLAARGQLSLARMRLNVALGRMAAAHLVESGW
jgi:ribonuclease I